MGYGEIRKAIRELEDQQNENHKHCLGQIALRNTAIELHRRARHKEVENLSGRITKLESENAEIRTGQVANRDAIADIRFQFNAVKGPLEHRVGLQDQVDLLQKSIGDLAEQVVRLEQEGDDEFWKSAWAPHGPKQRKQRQAQKRLQALADYIKDEIPNEPCPTEIEDVADTAIRLLKAYRAALEDIVEKTRSPAPAFELIYRIWEFASGTLKGKDDD